VTAQLQRELLAQALGDEPPFASMDIARDAIRAGRRRRRRRRFLAGIGAVGLAMLAAGTGYSLLPNHEESSSITAADGVPTSAVTPQAPASRPEAADLTLQRLLVAQGLTLGSRHGFDATSSGNAAGNKRIRGGFNVVGAGSVDVQLTPTGPSRCVDPACKMLPDGRSYLVLSEAVRGHPGFGVTTVTVFEGHGRMASVSMRNYPLTPAGRVEADGPVGSYPLSQQQLVDLAAAWAHDRIR